MSDRFVRWNDQHQSSEADAGRLHGGQRGSVGAGRPNVHRPDME